MTRSQLRGHQLTVSALIEKEWEFIQSEVHKEHSTDNNKLKRELLFILQILLSRMDYFNRRIYLMSKEKYLNINHHH